MTDKKKINQAFKRLAIGALAVILSACMMHNSLLLITASAIASFGFWDLAKDNSIRKTRHTYTIVRVLCIVPLAFYLWQLLKGIVEHNHHPASFYMAAMLVPLIVYMCAYRPSNTVFGKKLLKVIGFSLYFTAFISSQFCINYWESYDGNVVHYESINPQAVALFVVLFSIALLLARLGYMIPINKDVDNCVRDEYRAEETPVVQTAVNVVGIDIAHEEDTRVADEVDVDIMQDIEANAAEEEEIVASQGDIVTQDVEMEPEESLVPDEVTKEGNLELMNIIEGIFENAINKVHKEAGISFDEEERILSILNETHEELTTGERSHELRIMARDMKADYNVVLSEVFNEFKSSF